MRYYQRQRSHKYDHNYDYEDAPHNESEVSRQIVDALKKLGWRIYNFASYAALPPAAAGFPDIVAIRPGFPVLFIQVKAPTGGRLSPEQREFAEIIADTGAAYTQASSIDDVLGKLRQIGAILF